jgi:hypothetical protein
MHDVFILAWRLIDSPNKALVGIEGGFFKISFEEPVSSLTSILTSLLDNRERPLLYFRRFIAFM